MGPPIGRPPPHCGVCGVSSTPLILGPNISKTVRDKGSVPMDLQQEMANRMVTRSMTSRNFARSMSLPQYIWGPLSQKWLEIQTIILEHLQEMASGYQMVKCSMTSRDVKVKVVSQIYMDANILKTVEMEVRFQMTSKRKWLW